MLVILVVFGLAVVSEAGVIHQHQTGVGLNYDQFKRYPARPTLGRPYIVPPIGLRPAPLVRSFVFNSVPYNHAITPITVTRVESPLLQQRQPLTSTITKLLPTVGSAPLATLSYHKPSVALNLLPINAAKQQGAFNINFSPSSGFINQPATTSSALVGPPLLASSAVPTITSSYETINVIPKKAISYSISHQDYEYLKRHKVEGKDSPYNPIPGFNTSPGNEKHQNSHSHYKDDKAPINKPDETNSETALKRSTALKSGIQGNGQTKFIQKNNGPRIIQDNSEISFVQGKNDLSLIQGNSESSFTHIHEEQTNIRDDSGPSLRNVPYPVIQGNSETNFLQGNSGSINIEGNGGPSLRNVPYPVIQGNSETNFLQGNSGSINIEGNGGPSLINVPYPVIQGNSETNFLQGNSGSINIEGNGGPSLINVPYPVIQGNSETNFLQGNSGSINIEGNGGPSFINVLESVIQGNIETSFIEQGSNELNLIEGNSGTSSVRGNSVPTYIQGNVEPNFINVAEPVVSKHIYFHVPPPDFEEPPRVPITNTTPKKTYNILFIKAPSQNQQSNVYLQQLLQSRQNQIEDKTLIYVLSKKQDPVDEVLPPQQTSKVSSPEVYFVKYRTKLGDISDVSNEHVQQSLVENISSGH